MTTIREEQPGDVPGIRHVNTVAFDRPTEANLVDLLRERYQLLVSLVAEFKSRIIGHIAFSPVTIEPAPPHSAGAGLAPMAVVPDVQRQGVGTLLIHAGLDLCRKKGIDYIVVLGRPDYYFRFGFRPARHFGLACSWPVPEDVFMAQELRSGALANLRGTVRYQPEFDSV